MGGGRRIGSCHRGSSSVARFRGCTSYTSEAVGFYARLGWSVLDRTHWKGLDAALIVYKCRKRQGEGAAATANGRCAQDCDARKQLVQGHEICGA